MPFVSMSFESAAFQLLVMHNLQFSSFAQIPVNNSMVGHIEIIYIMDS